LSEGAKRSISRIQLVTTEVGATTRESGALRAGASPFFAPLASASPFFGFFAAAASAAGLRAFALDTTAADDDVRRVRGRSMAAATAATAAAAGASAAASAAGERSASSRTHRRSASVWSVLPRPMSSASTPPVRARCRNTSHENPSAWYGRSVAESPGGGVTASMRCSDIDARRSRAEGSTRAPGTRRRRS
jgi:hypothetical protein